MKTVKKEPDTLITRVEGRTYIGGTPAQEVAAMIRKHSAPRTDYELAYCPRCRQEKRLFGNFHRPTLRETKRGFVGTCNACAQTKERAGL